MIFFNQVVLETLDPLFCGINSVLRIFLLFNIYCSSALLTLLNLPKFNSKFASAAIFAKTASACDVSAALLASTYGEAAQLGHKIPTKPPYYPKILHLEKGSIDG